MIRLNCISAQSFETWEVIVLTAILGQLHVAVVAPYCLCYYRCSLGHWWLLLLLLLKQLLLLHYLLL